MWFEWLKGLGFSFANEKLVQLAIFFWKCKICRITRFYDKTKPKGQTDVLKKIKWRWSEVFFIAMVVHCIPNYFHPFYYFTYWTLWMFWKSKSHISFNCTLKIFPLPIIQLFTLPQFTLNLCCIKRTRCTVLSIFTVLLLYRHSTIYTVNVGTHKKPQKAKTV